MCNDCNNKVVLGNGALPAVTPACTEAAWIARNGNNLNFFYGEYPQLAEAGITLPVSLTALQHYYAFDMAERNLQPLPEMLSCYQFLFEYLIGRISNTINTKGRTWWQLTMQNLPGAFNKTMSDITNPFGLPLSFWLFAGLLTVVLIKS